MRRLSYLLLVSSVALMPASSFAAQGAAKAAKPAPAKAAASGGAARTVEITASDPSAPSAKYGYSVTTINAKPGERIHIVLKALGTMPKMASSHKFVLFKPGTKPSDITAFLQDSPMAAATNYIPASKKAMVLANTPMATDGGASVETTFTAPTAPGSYTYVCSFPGHEAAGMKGTLVVK